MKTNINVSAITNDNALQTVNADLSKLDIAGNQVALAVSELNLYITIANKQQQDDAMALLKLCKDIEKAIENRRKELVTPFNNTVKAYNDYAKKLTGDLSAAIEKVKEAVLAFQKAEAKKALQERTVKREAALVQIGFTYDAAQNLYKLAGVGSMTSTELEQYEDASFNNILSAWVETINNNKQTQAQQQQEQSDLDNLFGNDETKAIAVADLAPVVVAPVNGYKVDAVKGTTKRWTFEITDQTQIPRDYLMPDEVKINAAIRAGIREIPGVKIFQAESLTIR